MPFDDWKKLLYGIKKGECILFLGPDLPLVPPGGERRYPAGDLTDKLASALPSQEDGPASLAQIAQRFLIEKDDYEFEIQVSEWHQALSDEPSELHDDLAALPFRLIITSGHDPLLEAALRRAGKFPSVERYHYKGKNNERIADPTEAAPLLFHLYGHVGEADSLVLSETQLLDFLANLIARDPPLPRFVDAQLTTGRLFLFLGFGLRHWYLRILLHVLKVLRKRCVSFAIEALNVENAKPPRDAILFYQDNFKLDVHQQDVVEFVKRLRAEYVPPARTATATATVAATSSTPPVGPAADGPTVFICHASENKDTAQEVHDVLERSGLQPWIDKEDLRGGDRWDDVIQSTIEDVSYFVVLNSHELLAKTKNPKGEYVNREIKAALEGTRDRFTRFIFPVQIDDAKLFEPLGPFQSIDLRSKKIEEIARAIKRAAEKAS